MVGDAERRARGGELADPVAAELVRGVGREQGQLRGDHLALLTERARDQRDGGVGVGGVPRHRAAGRQCLVVRMGVHEQQPAAGGAARGVRSGLDRARAGAGGRPVRETAALLDVERLFVALAGVPPRIGAALVGRSRGGRRCRDRTGQCAPPGPLRARRLRGRRPCGGASPGAAGHALRAVVAREMTRHQVPRAPAAGCSVGVSLDAPQPVALGECWCIPAPGAEPAAARRVHRARDVAAEHDPRRGPRSPRGSGIGTAEISAWVYGCVRALEQRVAAPRSPRSRPGTSPRPGRRCAAPPTGRGR